MIRGTRRQPFAIASRADDVLSRVEGPPLPAKALRSDGSVQWTRFRWHVAELGQATLPRLRAGEIDTDERYKNEDNRLTAWSSEIGESNTGATSTIADMAPCRGCAVRSAGGDHREFPG